MAPRSRPRTNRPRHEVLEQHPQVLGLESNRRGATQTQSATVQSNLNRNTRERATEDITSNQDDPIDVETEPVGNKRKRVRGPTCMSKVWGQQPDELVAVSFNDLGQPNDEFKTCTLSHFLGTIARNGRYCPLHYKDWRLMPRSYKDEMLRIVKAKFELLLGKESYILKSINKKWRNWKSYVKSLNFDPNIPIEQQMLDIPSRVDEDQYKALVKHWMSNKSKKISEKNKQTRAKLELLHRMGKKSFAIVKEIMKKRLGRYPTRAELFEECYYRPDGSLTSEMIRESIEQMKEVSEQEQEPECSNDNDCVPNLNDAYAKIMGQDKHGYLRMYGMGVTPADVCGAIPGRDASYRLAMEYKSKYMEAVEKFDALNAKVESLSALVNGRAQSVGQVDVQNIPLSSSNNQRSSASMSHSMRIRVHSRVVLKSLGNINEIVASDYVSEMENVKVNGEELGSDWCEITIQSQMKKDARLLRPYGNIQTIEDTLGAPVAWPLSLVALDETFD